METKTNIEKVKGKHYEIGNGNICEYGVYVYRQDGKVFLSLCDAENGENAYTEIHNCPMCGRKFGKD